MAAAKVTAINPIAEPCDGMRVGPSMLRRRKTPAAAMISSEKRINPPAAMSEGPRSDGAVVAGKLVGSVVGAGVGMTAARNLQFAICNLRLKTKFCNRKSQIANRK